MFDEIRCEATLPEGERSEGIWFQTKSFPGPSLSRFVITPAGRLLDLQGNDWEPDGYLVMYTIDDDTAEGTEAKTGVDESERIWREYRLNFVRGQLQGIERVTDSTTKDRHVGLASYRWFNSPSRPDPDSGPGTGPDTDTRSR